MAESALIALGWLMLAVLASCAWYGVGYWIAIVLARWRGEGFARGRWWGYPMTLLVGGPLVLCVEVYERIEMWRYRRLRERRESR